MSPAEGHAGETSDLVARHVAHDERQLLLQIGPQQQDQLPEFLRQSCW